MWYDHTHYISETKSVRDMRISLKYVQKPHLSGLWRNQTVLMQASQNKPNINFIEIYSVIYKGESEMYLCSYFFSVKRLLSDFFITALNMHILNILAKSPFS